METSLVSKVFLAHNIHYSLQLICFVIILPLIQLLFMVFSFCSW